MRVRRKVVSDWLGGDVCVSSLHSYDDFEKE